MSYKEGSWWVSCQRCGFKKRSEEITREWTGLLVCKDKCLDIRHPQDFVKSRPDDQSVPFSNPPPADVFVPDTYISSTVGTQENTKPTGTFTIPADGTRVS